MNTSGRLVFTEMRPREVQGMTNIPTELLRALIAVVDQRSFTKAAVVLGLTQPAVSAQIKRLQFPARL